MVWMRYNGLILRRNGKIARDPKCCCVKQATCCCDLDFTTIIWQARIDFPSCSALDGSTARLERGASVFWGGRPEDFPDEATFCDALRWEFYPWTKNCSPEALDNLLFWCRGTTYSDMSGYRLSIVPHGEGGTYQHYAGNSNVAPADGYCGAGGPSDPSWFRFDGFRLVETYPGSAPGCASACYGVDFSIWIEEA